MKASREERRTIGPHDDSDLLTLASVVSAGVGVCLSICGLPRLTFVTLVICGILDSFDGRFASSFERTKVSRAYGAELDSVSDVVAFGCQPACLLLSYTRGTAWLWCAAVVCAVYLVCAARRLAWFGALDRTGLADGGFVGVPVTYTALVVPVVVAFAQLLGLGAYVAQVLTLALLALAVGFVANVPVRRPGTKLILAQAVVALVCALFIALAPGAWSA